MAFLKFFSFALLFIGIASSQQVSGKNDKPFLRIVAPQYICDSKEKSMNKSSDSNKLTIGLQTRAGQRLRYKIAIDFTILEGFKNQRHTLSIWKNVRELEKKFQTNSVADEISLRNQIEIDSSELTPAVVYTFKIIGVDNDKHESDEQNFTITYKGDKLEAVHSNLGDGVSLLLYGPETFYNDLELLAVADVLFCDPVNDYYYRWKVKGMSETDESEYLDIKGSTLKIPSGVLSADSFYEASVTIFNNKSQAMASLSLPINVFSKEFQVQNIPAACSVGLNSAPYMTSLYRSPIVKDIVFEWRCAEECSNAFTNSTSSHQVTVAFQNEGSFELQAQVTLKGATKSSTTRVSVDPRIIPHAEVKYFPQLPINTKAENEFVMTLMDLVPKCMAQWSVVSDTNFAKPKSDNLTNLGAIWVKDYEEHFLQELVDYDNNTLSKDITLTVPSDGLHADTKYKFRLSVVCPEPLQDTMSSADRKNISAFYDIEFETNEPPVALPLQIEPLRGIPMRDKFTFKTGAGKDKKSDFPLKYTFGYTVENLTIVIGSFYEFQVALTQLPFSDDIYTFYEVSDNNNASIHVKGPIVRANESHRFTEAEISFKLSEIEGLIRRAEYSKALNSAVTLILTQRKFATLENARRYEEAVYEMLKSELELLKLSKSLTYVYQENVKEFVKMSKNLIGIMTVYDEAFIENILSLTETSNRVKRAILSNGLRNSRGIMTASDPDYIKNVLSLSDMLLSSQNSDISRREKKKFVEKIHQFVKSLCQTPNLKAHTIESKFVVFEVSKIYSRQLYDEPQKFSKEKSSIIFSPNSVFPAKFLCIGKIRYMLDMFDTESEEGGMPVYETRILDDAEGGEKLLVQGESVGEYAIMEIPLKKSDSTELSCAIWLDNRWSAKSCENFNLDATSKIACKCRTANASVIIKYQKKPAQHVTERSVTDKGSESTLKFGDLTTASSVSAKPTTTMSGQDTKDSDESETTMNDRESTLKFGSLTTPSNFLKATTSVPSQEVITTDENIDKTTEPTVKPTDSTTPSSNGNTVKNSEFKESSTTDFATTEKIIEKTTEPTVKFVDLTTSSSNRGNTVDNSEFKERSTTDVATTEKTTSEAATESLVTEKSTTTIIQSFTESTTEGIFTESGNLPTAIELPTTRATDISTKPTTTEANKKEKEEKPTENVSTTTNEKPNTTAFTNEASESMKMNKSSNGNKKGEKGATKNETGKPSDNLLPTTVIKTNGNGTSDGDRPNKASINWVVIGLLCLFFLIILILILLHRCRRLSENSINLPMRQASNDIKYAKYHDEFIMRG